MKSVWYYVGLLSFSSFLIVVSSTTNSATAQCVQADIGIQYNVSGSTEPTERTNDVDMESSGSCRRNVSVTTGVQGNVGGNAPVRQHRRVRHSFEGNDSNDSSSGSTVQIKVNPQIDVYNAADNLNY